MGRKRRKRWQHFLPDFEADLKFKGENSYPRLYLCEVCLQSFEQGKDLRIHKENMCGALLNGSFISSKRVTLDLTWLEQLESFQLLRRALQNGMKLKVEQLTGVNVTDISTIDVKKITYTVDNLDVKNEIKALVKGAPKITKNMRDFFKCEKCGKLCCSKYMLRTHLNGHFGIKPYKCPKCGLGLSQKAGLTAHLRTHTGSRPFECKICHKRFSQPVSRQHMDVHSGERRFKCDLCLSVFGSQTVLKTHKIAKHSLLRPFQCDICMKTFADKYYMHKHKTIHRVVRPYPCTICPKSFITKSNLVRHLLIHSGGLPYKCDTCGKMYNNQGSLSYHLTTHSKERHYKCGLCGQHLSTKQNLQKHLEIHAERNEHTMSCPPRYFNGTGTNRLQRYTKKQNITKKIT